MITIRHVGIYVNDINLLEKFYTKVFHMTVICRQEPDTNKLLDQLLDKANVKIITTKLITEYGRQKGFGDMLELVKIVGDKSDRICGNMPISNIGTAHIAFEVNNIEDTVGEIIRNGGKQKTDIAVMENYNKLCFCVDPEGNWLELIQHRL